MKNFLAVIPFLALSAISSANLVVNGDFETDSYLVHQPISSITGWSIVPSNTSSVAGVPVGYLGAPTQEIDLSGFVDSGPPPTTGIQQTITTVASQRYYLSFEVFAGAQYSGYAGGVDVFVNGSQIANDLEANRTSFSYSFIGTGSDTIKFLSHEGYVSHIDNVGVVAAPAPAALASFAFGALRLRRRRK